MHSSCIECPHDKFRKNPGRAGVLHLLALTPGLWNHGEFRKHFRICTTIAKRQIINKRQNIAKTRQAEAEKIGIFKTGNAWVAAISSSRRISTPAFQKDPVQKKTTIWNMQILAEMHLLQAVWNKMLHVTRQVLALRLEPLDGVVGVGGNVEYFPVITNRIFGCSFGVFLCAGGQYIFAYFLLQLFMCLPKGLFEVLLTSSRHAKKPQREEVEIGEKWKAWGRKL